MRQLAFESDIFVWPTWGEGWGMPPVEMAGTGMPSVLPNYSGIEAYFNPAWCLDLPYTVGPIHKGSHSVGANITLEDLKDKMRWAYDHREDVRAMGKVAAQDVSEHRTWEKATRPALRKVLEYYG
jgi:glycosyltransferase involved in cell wall biosynthesis